LVLQDQLTIKPWKVPDDIIDHCLAIHNIDSAIASIFAIPKSILCPRNERYLRQLAMIKDIIGISKHRDLKRFIPMISKRYGWGEASIVSYLYQALMSYGVDPIKRLQDLGRAFNLPMLTSQEVINNVWKNCAKW
jgi:hypothetical protein